MERDARCVKKRSEMIMERIKTSKEKIVGTWRESSNVK
jgi:hypothetical protein